MQKMINVALACTAILLSVHGYPTGAPTEVCETMYPQHGFEAQAVPPPYEVKASVLPNDPTKFRVQLQTIGDYPAFKGFMLQARAADGDHQAIGSFIELDTKEAKTLNCGSGHDNSLTHISNNEKKGVVVTWKAPDNFTGRVKFLATFVQTYRTFWVQVPSRVIEISK